MGIGGITYTDGRGRRRSIDAASLDDFKRQVSPAMRAHVTPQLPQIGGGRRAQQTETMPGASVVNTRNGLALKGEENDPTVAGKKVYGSVDGAKGWHTLDEVDPESAGRRVGAPVGCNDETEVTESVEGFDGKAFRSPVLSRICLSIDKVTGQLTLFEFQKEIGASSGRRMQGVSGEVRRVVGTWFPGKVEPNDGAKFHFGYNKEYDSDSGETTVTIGDGAVQIGGYTYFVGHGEVSDMSDGTCYVCVVVNLSSGTASFKAYATTSALNTAQSDLTKYIFPLYKTVDYNITMDYRPMPNAGCWEIAEGVSNGGTS